MMKLRTMTYKSIRQFSVAIVLMMGISFSAFGQYVTTNGDSTITGTLSIEAQGSITPALEIYGASNVYKFVRFKNSDDGTTWDLSMDETSNGLSLWLAPLGQSTWIPFSIDTNGILYGNAAGLSNINVEASRAFHDCNTVI